MSLNNPNQVALCTESYELRATRSFWVPIPRLTGRACKPKASPSSYPCIVMTRPHLSKIFQTQSFHLATEWFFRLVLSFAFLSAVADRFGLWGGPGAPEVKKRLLSTVRVEELTETP